MVTVNGVGTCKQTFNDIFLSPLNATSGILIFSLLCLKLSWLLSVTTFCIPQGSVHTQRSCSFLLNDTDHLNRWYERTPIANRELNILNCLTFQNMMNVPLARTDVIETQYVPIHTETTRVRAGGVSKATDTSVIVSTAKNYNFSFSFFFPLFFFFFFFFFFFCKL